MNKRDVMYLLSWIPSKQGTSPRFSGDIYDVHIWRHHNMLIIRTSLIFATGSHLVGQSVSDANLSFLGRPILVF